MQTTYHYTFLAQVLGGEVELDLLGEAPLLLRGQRSLGGGSELIIVIVIVIVIVLVIVIAIIIIIILTIIIVIIVILVVIISLSRDSGASGRIGTGS